MKKEKTNRADTRILYNKTLLYRGTMLIHIDESWDALYWAARHGMEKTDSVVCFNTGREFDIYENRARGLACAIPS